MYNVSATRLTLYAFISAIELDLRNFIAINTNDQNEKRIFDSQLIDRLKDRSKKNGVYEMDILNLIEFIDFGDCTSLLAKFKDFFSEEHIEKLTKLVKMLERITPVRNRVMHSRPLEFDDFPFVTDFINNINEYDFLDWNNTNDIKVKISVDPTIIFGMKIPEFVDSYEQKILHNLPSVEFDDTGFIGRDKDLDSIKRKLFGNFPVVSIIGDGGIGKTALVLKCIYDVLDDPRNKFDAIIWVSLKTRSLSNGEFKNIKNAFTSTLDIYKEIKSVLIGKNTEYFSNEELIDDIIEYMSKFNILLVLDNLETINSESIREFIGCIPSGSKVLITSRIGMGEFESRQLLEGLGKKERIFYLKRLLTNNQLNDVLRLGDQKLNSFCEKLYSNPLAIKWFVASLLKKVPIESILAHTEELTFYCMSNVYDKLSKNAKSVLETLLIYNHESSDAELAYLLELDPILHRQALNELLATNMIRMRSTAENNEVKSVFSITDFAKEYLRQHYKPSNDSFLRINNRIKQLRGLEQNLVVNAEINPFAATTITYSPDNSDEIIAAYNLKQALVASSKEDYQTAFNLIDKAKEIAPSYFEAYKISAYLNALNGNFYAANEEYETAIQCKPNYAPLLLLYAGFKSRYMEDFAEALELILRAEHEAHKEMGYVHVSIEIEKARLYMLLGNHEFAEKLFLSLIEKMDTFRSKSKRITIDLAAENYRRWAERKIAEEQGGDALLLLKKSMQTISLLGENYEDQKITITVSKVIKTLRLLCKPENQEAIDFLVSICKEYGYKLRYSQRYSDVKKALSHVYQNLPMFVRATLDEFIFEDIKEIARKVTSENEGIVYSVLEKYGFIVNGKFDGLFFYWKEFKGEYSKLKTGTKVKFDIGVNERGNVAKNVNVIEAFSD